MDTQKQDMADVRYAKTQKDTDGSNNFHYDFDQNQTKSNPDLKPEKSDTMGTTSSTPTPSANRTGKVIVVTGGTGLVGKGVQEAIEREKAADNHPQDVSLMSVKYI